MPEGRKGAAGGPRAVRAAARLAAHKRKQLAQRKRQRVRQFPAPPYLPTVSTLLLPHLSLPGWTQVREALPGKDDISLDSVVLAAEQEEVAVLQALVSELEDSVQSATGQLRGDSAAVIDTGVPTALEDGNVDADTTASAARTKGSARTAVPGAAFGGIGGASTDSTRARGGALRTGKHDSSSSRSLRGSGVGGGRGKGHVDGSLASGQRGLRRHELRSGTHTGTGSQSQAKVRVRHELRIIFQLSLLCHCPFCLSAFFVLLCLASQTR